MEINNPKILVKCENFPALHKISFTPPSDQFFSFFFLLPNNALSSTESNDALISQASKSSKLGEMEKLRRVVSKFESAKNRLVKYG